MVRRTSSDETVSLAVDCTPVRSVVAALAVAPFDRRAGGAAYRIAFDLAGDVDATALSAANVTLERHGMRIAADAAAGVSVVGARVTPRGSIARPGTAAR